MTTLASPGRQFARRIQIHALRAQRFYLRLALNHVVTRKDES